MSERAQGKKERTPEPHAHAEGHGHGEGRGHAGSDPRAEEATTAAPTIERLDRYILVVTPRQPLVDWVLGLDKPWRPEEVEGEVEGVPDFTLEEARTYHRSTYLVPTSDDAHDVEGWVEDNFDLVFEQELFAFEHDRGQWPPARSLDTFLDWFDLEILDAPIDLVDAPLVAHRHGRTESPGTQGS